jgi:hypothetical protein
LSHELLMLSNLSIAFFSSILNEVDSKLVHIKVSHHSLILFILRLREIKVHNVLLLFLSKDRVFIALHLVNEPVFERISDHIGKF